MTTEAYRGVVRGGMVVLREKQMPLTDGTEVLVTPIGGIVGSPETVLSAVGTSPRVPSEWVDELEEIIAQGRRPPTHNDPFREEPGYGLPLAASHKAD